MIRNITPPPTFAKGEILSLSKTISSGNYNTTAYQSIRVEVLTQGELDFNGIVIASESLSWRVGENVKWMKRYVVVAPKNS